MQGWRCTFVSGTGHWYFVNAAEVLEVQCRAGDVPLSVEHIRYYAGWADKIHGSIVTTGGKFYAQVHREPLGKHLPSPLFIFITASNCSLSAFFIFVIMN